TGGVQGSGSASNIAYTDHLLADEAKFHITQITPSNGGSNRVDVKVEAFNVTGNEQGLNFFDGSPTTGSTISRVQVLAADNVTIIEDSGNPAINDPSISIQLNGASATILNLLAGHSVRFTTSNPMDRFAVTNIDGGSNTTFDLGGISFIGSIIDPTDTYQEVGSLITFKDDGPSISPSGTTLPNIMVDETTLGTSSHASFAGSFGAAVLGADGGTLSGYKLATVGGDSGLVDTATSQKVVLSESGGVIYGKTETSGLTVFTVSVDASGDVTFLQSRAIKHPDPSNNDETLHLASTAGLITLSLGATDGDGDKASAVVDITNAFAIKDDGPSISPITPIAGVLTVDESHLTAATNVWDGSDPNLALTSATIALSTLFSAPIYGADGSGADPSIHYKLAIAADGIGSGLYDTDTQEQVFLKVDASGTKVSGYCSSGDVFTVELDGAGNVKLTQLQAVMHSSPDLTTDVSEPASLLGTGLISIQASVTDGDQDPAIASVDLTQAIRFLDDGPSIGPVLPTNNGGTFNVQFTSGHSNAGTIGGVEGADDPYLKLTSVTDVSHPSVRDMFNIVQTGNHADFYLKTSGEKWFDLDIVDNGPKLDAYTFRVLHDGGKMNEMLDFSIKAGPPTETLKVNSVFDHAHILFDGLIFGDVATSGVNLVTDPTLAKYNIGAGGKNSDASADDINPDNLGFGIKGVNPSQASQINNNEGFFAYMGQDADNFKFGVQGIGNNAKGVQVEYWLYNDADNNPANNGTAGNLGAVIQHGIIDLDNLASGNHLEYVALQSQTLFDTV
ncbi:MAG: hypothetical protein EBY21_13360, partial [Alphaproteobacteria bacterium]|nr:hypothetical protein [Alphaproteobacteria bacterium]